MVMKRLEKTSLLDAFHDHIVKNQQHYLTLGYFLHYIGLTLVHFNTE